MSTLGSHGLPTPLPTGSTARVFTASELTDLGGGRVMRRRDREAAGLRAVRKGVYTDAPAPGRSAADAELDLLVRSLAAVRRIASGTVLSHESALVVHGLPLIGIRSGPVVTTRHRPGGGSRHTSLMRCHNVSLDGATTEVRGVPVTTVERTLVDLARSGEMIGAVCAADHALHHQQCDVEDLRAEVGRAAGRRGVHRARELAELVDCRAESPLESLSRFAIRGAGLPVPELQVELILPDGRLVRADMLWREQRVIGECDGLGKYGIDGEGIEAVRDSLRREKDRQNLLEEMGFRVVRWTWADAWHSERLIERLEGAFALQARAGFPPISRWTTALPAQASRERSPTGRVG